MTDRLPSCTARDVDRALKRGGFIVYHQRGSPDIMQAL
jgi:predicted RNA binding protein YcfA (HicA-like mRNA interferase family)